MQVQQLHLPPRQSTGAAAISTSQAPTRPFPPTAGPCGSGGYLCFAGLQLLLSLLVLHGLCGESWGKTERGSGSRKEKVGSDGRWGLEPGELDGVWLSPRPRVEPKSPRSGADRPRPHQQRRHRRRHLRLHVNTRRGGTGEEGVGHVRPRSRREHRRARQVRPRLRSASLVARTPPAGSVGYHDLASDPGSLQAESRRRRAPFPTNVPPRWRPG